MKRYAFLLVTTASFALGTGFLTAGGDDAVKKDQKAMTGTWKVISLERDGKKTPAEQLEKTRGIVAADGKVMVQRDGKTAVQYSFKLDPSKKPKQFEGDYSAGELKGKTVLGIYEIDGDSMKTCYALPGKDRPTEFSSKEGSGHVFIVYKREKP